MKLDELKQDFQRCNINPTIVKSNFSDWKSLPKHSGLYSIWQGDRCIYVGQAGGKDGFKGRFLHHWNKAYNIKYSSTSHSKGWVAGRLTEDWAPDSWTIEYFCCTKATHRTYLESAMMLIFEPLCNDETYEDSNGI